MVPVPVLALPPERRDPWHGDGERRSAGLPCNIFFYHVGIDVGIETLTGMPRPMAWASPPALSWPSPPASTPDRSIPPASAQRGTRGNTLSAAIGQSDNPFTPLQIANYVATLVNGGTRYAAHLLQRVTDADGNVTEYEPKVLNTGASEPESGRHQAGYAGGGAEYEIRGSGLQKSDRRRHSGGRQDRLRPGHRSENANGLFVCFCPPMTIPRSPSAWQ